MQQETLHHGSGGLVPVRVVRPAFMDDDDGIGYPTRLVDRFFVVRVERFEGIEVTPEGVVHLGGMERIKNADDLTHPFAVIRSLTTAGAANSRVFAFWVDTDEGAGPKN
jgi:hypothetical protein